ncbi:hypothetical protein C0J52_22257, partial [Blattella germanica]
EVLSIWNLQRENVWSLGCLPGTDDFYQLAAFGLGKWLSLIYNLFFLIYCFCFFFFFWIFSFSCFSICHALAEVFFLILKIVFL